METSTVIGIIIAVAVVAMIILVRRERSDDMRGPDMEPEPRMIDGVAVGQRTYADLDMGRCVDVVKVEDKTVYFFFTGQNDGRESLFLNVDRFLERFYRTPNGCDNSVVVPLREDT